MVQLHGSSYRSPPPPPPRRRRPSNSTGTTSTTTWIVVVERSVLCIIGCALLLSRSLIIDATAFVIDSSPSPLIFHRHRSRISSASSSSSSSSSSSKSAILPKTIARLHHLSSTTTNENTQSSSSSSTTTRTIQILMSDTGGGHRASANALRDAFDELYPADGSNGGNTIRCDIVDIYTEYGPFFPFDSFVPIYQLLQANPILWGIGFQFSATEFGLKFNEVMLELFCFEPFLECMTRPIGTSEQRADMVVSVHPLTQDVPLRVLNYIDSDGAGRDGGRTTPFATVVTDLGSAHPTWFNPNVDRCFVPSDALDRAAQDRDISPDRITKHGLPIRKGFWASTPTTGGEEGADGSSRAGTADDGEGGIMGNLLNLIRFPGGGGGNNGSGSESKSTPPPPTVPTVTSESLGLTPDIPTVLIVGGGDGMGGIVQQAKAMGNRLSTDASPTTPNNTPSYQMVVVCGKNDEAKKELSSVEWGDGVAVEVKGFVNNMDEFMRASDVLVTKAGPGTIAEASICGLPCMLSSFLPGQEEGNIPFVKDAGFGSYSGDPKEIADTVSTWLSSPERLATMKENALMAARPTATIDIARDLAEMLFSRES